MFIDCHDIDALLHKIAAAPALDKLKKTYSNFSTVEFEAVLDADPTYIEGSGRPGSYTMWLLRLWKQNPGMAIEDGYKAKEYLDAFDVAKRRFTGKDKDIYSYKSLPELYDKIQDFLVEEPEESDYQLRKRIQKAGDDVEVLYEDEDWKVLIPNSYEASCYWGVNTEWCTATRSTREHYDQYMKSGSLVIFINKKDPTKKYQYHYESRSFMDETDRSFDLMTFMEKQDNTAFKSFLLGLDEDMAQEYYDKFYEAESVALHETFDEEYKEELREYLDESGELPQYIMDHVWEYIYQGDSYTYERIGDPLYLYWDAIREDIKENLGIIKDEEYQRRLKEEGQGQLFEEAS